MGVVQGQRGLWPRLWEWCLLTGHPPSVGRLGPRSGQAVYPKPCCGCGALGGEAWAALPEGELGEGPQAKGWAADLSPAGTGFISLLMQGIGRPSFRAAVGLL